jgi:hypothetical protein
MGMTQEQAVALVLRERVYQDKTYQPDRVLSTGVTRQARDLDPTAGITMLSAYVRKAEDAWVNMKDGDSTLAIQQVAKIAAIALRILERSGGSEKLLTAGLR